MAVRVKSFHSWYFVYVFLIICVNFKYGCLLKIWVYPFNRFLFRRILKKSRILKR